VKLLFGGAVQSVQMWRLLAERDMDAIEADLNKRITVEGYTLPEPELVEAFRALRRGDLGTARSQLELTEEGPWSRIVAGLLAKANADAAIAAEIFMQIADEYPLDVMGGVARELARQCDPSSVLPSAVNLKEAQVCALIPVWIDGMATDPRLHQIVTATLATEAAAALEPVQMTITVTNLSRIPLGLGGDRTISSRFLLTPVLESRMGGVRLAEPVVCEIQTRFRLLPSESVSTTIDAETGVTGWLSSLWCRFPTRLRWRVLQGFEPDVGQSRRPGPGSTEFSLPTLVRSNLTDALKNEAELAQSISTALEAQVPTLLYAARTMLLDVGPQSNETLVNKAVVTEALLTRYQAASPALRMFMLATLPPSSKCVALTAFDQFASMDTDPALHAMYVLTRVTAPDDPAFARYETQTASPITRAVLHHRDRLNEGRPTYASDYLPMLPPGKQP